MKKKLALGFAIACALVAPLSGCSPTEVTLEWCDEHRTSGERSQEEADKCNALYREQAIKEAAEAQKRADEAKAKAEAKIQRMNDNLVVKNFKADYERGAYVITMDIENTNDFDVSDITVTIPYGEHYQDNYGDTKMRDNKFVEEIALIPAKETHSIKIAMSKDYAEQKMEAIDEKKITITGSESVGIANEEIQSVSVEQFDVRFRSEAYGAFYTITNNTNKKIEFVTLEGYMVNKDGNYMCIDSSCARRTVSAGHLKPGQTSDEEAGGGYSSLIDLQLIEIEFADD